MRVRTLALLLFWVVPLVHGQAPSAEKSGLPHDPAQVFSAAAPYYDYDDASLKPWRLKATYQLFDQSGRPTQRGTYEYWWASPKLHRSSWTRGTVTRTDWHTPDGKHVFQSSGGRLEFFERRLQRQLLDPLPTREALDLQKVRLEREDKRSKAINFPCISLIPRQQGEKQDLPPGFYPVYCFEPTSPILRLTYTFGEVAGQFNNIVKFQNRFLARDIVFQIGERKLFAARVDSVEKLDPADPALKPPADALPESADWHEVASSELTDSIVKKKAPVYPQQSKDLHEQGVVMLQLAVDAEGKVSGAQVIVAPSELLATAAVEAALHWEYKPRIVDGKAMAFETITHVTFSLGP
jgi:TonB family protein